MAGVKISAFPALTTQAIGPEIIPVVSEGVNYTVPASDFLGGYTTPEMYSAVGDGITSDQQALEDAVAVSGANILLTQTYLLTTSLTVPSDVTLTFRAGASIIVPNSETLTIESYFECGLYRVFDCVGTGVVVLNNCRHAYPEWWTDNAEPGTTDMTSAIQAALDSGATEIVFTATYAIQSDSDYGSAITLTSAHDNIVMIGHGTIKAVTDTDKYFYMFRLTTCKGLQVIDLNFDGNADANWSSNPVNPVNAYHIFYFNPTTDDDVADITFYNCSLRGSYDSAIQSYGAAAHSYPHPTSTRIKIGLCHFEDIGVSGVGMNEWTDSSVTSCTFYNIGRKIMLAGYGSGLAVDVSGGCNNVVVSANVVDGCGGGFKAERHTTLVYAQNVTISNNVIRNCYAIATYSALSTYVLGEIVIDSAVAYKSLVAGNIGNTPASSPTKWEVYNGTALSGAVGDYSVWFGIKLSGRNNHAIGNVIESFGRAIFIDFAAVGCSAVGNTIVSTACTAIRVAQGIYIEYNETAGHVITGNTIRDTQSTGIYCMSPNVVISGNTITGALAGSGIRITDGVTAGYNSHSVSVTNNICVDNVGQGIHVARVTPSGDPTTISDILVANNVCRDTGGGVQTRGVFIEDYATGIYDITEYGNVCTGHTISSIGYDVDNTSATIAGKKISYRNTIPAAGTWNRGDLCIMNIPDTIYPFGWVCTAQGTYEDYTDSTGDTTAGSATITGMTDTSGLLVGSYVTISGGFPSASTRYRVSAVLSATSIVIELSVADKAAVTTASNVTVATANPIFAVLPGPVATFTTSPVAAPNYVGQEWINTATRTIYKAVGVGNVGDWIDITGGVFP